MPFQYSTLSLPNPVSQPLISRFYVHHDTPYESLGDAPTDGYDDLKPSARTASGHRHFSGCFSRSLLERKDASNSQQLRKLASPSRNPQVRSTGGQ